jgi:hypothetical protein
MRRAALTALPALFLVCVAFAAAGRSALETVLFDAPRGVWLGALRGDAPLVVLEERDGWRRVRLEGWIAAPTAAPEGTVGPDSSVPTAPALAVVQGVLAPPLRAGGTAGAGVLVLLVKEDSALDSEHRNLGIECRARLDQKDRDLGTLRAEADHALNSSDNFREASGRNDRARTRLATGQRERRDLIRECRTRAQAVFEGAVTGRAISDASGRFEFQGVVPGRYRVVAFETTGDAPRSWSFSFLVEGSAPRVLDPIADRSAVPADWGLQ